MNSPSFVITKKLNSFTSDLLLLVKSINSSSLPQQNRAHSTRCRPTEKMPRHAGRIVNLSLSTGVFPSSLKASSHLYYRPVSNLSFLSKLIERAVLMLLTEHLTKFNLFPDHQSAYRANYSTETALVSLYNDLLKTADAGEASALLLLDLSAAFDTIV